MAEPIIKIDHLNFYYDYKLPTQMYALKDINIEINKGEYVVFFGPSGCGKTTLIYLIGGITTEKGGDGRILVNNADVLGLSRDDLTIFRQTGIGIIFQNFNLIPSLTVLDNVALPMTFIGVPQDERRATALKILERLNMEQYAQRFPSELSGGQQQRVGIARALANNPPIIIADEPLGNLDSENAEHVLKFLKELQTKDGRTVIMVTHEAWSVRDAEKIIYLKDGAVVKTSTDAREEAATQQEVLPMSPNIFKELYPDLTPDEIMIKSLSNLLLRGFSGDEIKRFEFYLEQRLAGKIDTATFENFLDLPYRKDGVGLWKQRAHKIADLTDSILTEKKKLSDVYKDLEKNPEVPVAEEVNSLRVWILKEYKGIVDETQRERLDEVITGRLRNNISTEDFRKTVNLGRAHGGVGFSIRTTQHISDRLEAVLVWGQTGNMKDAVQAIAAVSNT
jgi:putative ABC transport system ATP-binding protein